jgi:hypothetical protein
MTFQSILPFSPARLTELGTLNHPALGPWSSCYKKRCVYVGGKPAQEHDWELTQEGEAPAERRTERLSIAGGSAGASPSRKPIFANTL